MEIKFSPEQYEDLIKMVFLGNFMINYARNPEERIKNFDDLEQYLYSFAKEFDFEKNLIYLNDIKRKIPNKEFLESSGLRNFVSDFIEDVFWGELTNRLASRDTLKQYGEENLKNLTLEEFLKKQEPFLKKYDEEFQKNGLENLELK